MLSNLERLQDAKYAYTRAVIGRSAHLESAGSRTQSVDGNLRVVVILTLVSRIGSSMQFCRDWHIALRRAGNLSRSAGSLRTK